MSEKYGFSGWVWILAAVIVVGFVALGSYLIQTQQRLRAVEIDLGGAKEETGRARAGAAEVATVVEKSYDWNSKRRTRHLTNIRESWTKRMP